VARLLHATLGGIPFDRQRRNVARALALPAQVLRNGHALIFYPEGTRSLDGTLHPFRSTVGLLALASAAPIVPAAISGAAQALPKGRLWIAHHPVRVRFGPPIAIEPYLACLDGESVASVSRRIARTPTTPWRGCGRTVPFRWRRHGHDEEHHACTSRRAGRGAAGRPYDPAPGGATRTCGATTTRASSSSTRGPCT
jgi:hypothetical protein